MEGSGGASEDDVMLIDDIRLLRRAGLDECAGCGDGRFRELDAEAAADAATADIVARNRENDEALVSVGRLSSVGAGTGGECTGGSIRTAPSPKSPSSSLLDDRYIEPQLGSSRLGVGDRELGCRFRR